MIEIPGTTSSGEVEFVLLKRRSKLYVGVGSDHTDRKVEAYNVTVSKQMCAKPLAPELWRFADVADHWDRLILRSWIGDPGSLALYQEGLVSSIRHPNDLLSTYGDQSSGNTMAMFCGTLAVRGGIRPSSRFEFELEDPVRGRRIRHGYAIANLPVAG
jgi:hypothetical protein